jgi:hypothetical protein
LYERGSRDHADRHTTDSIRRVVANADVARERAGCDQGDIEPKGPPAARDAVRVVDHDPASSVFTDTWLRTVLVRGKRVSVTEMCAVVLRCLRESDELRGIGIRDRHGDPYYVALAHDKPMPPQPAKVIDMAKRRVRRGKEGA